MSLLNILFPPLCAACGEPVFWDAEPPGWDWVFEGHVRAYPDRFYEALWEWGAPPRRGASNLLCPACLAQLSFPAWKACPRCGGRADAANLLPHGCSWCHRQKFAFTRTVSLGPYWGPLRAVITAMKQPHGKRLAQAMARVFWCQRGTQLRELAPDCVVPIPMHRRRKRQRQMNSPEILADVLADFLGIPTGKHVLYRMRPTLPQSSLKPAQRWKNVRGAFSVVFTPWDRIIMVWTRKRVPGAGDLRQKEKLHRADDTDKQRREQPRRSPSVHPRLAGRRVLLVDDVLTTGATCHEAAKVLLEAGAQEVFVAVLGRGQTPATADFEPEHTR
ncbi:phosphoribosyltransferase family protein [Thermogutta sp.]|uniref:ComF family protein n=1 Tax=Thermogutta sp. TaxID=1962930 RepID=UPI00321F6270